MIQHRTLLLPPSDGNPGLVSKDQAVRPCGCIAICGLRVDNREVALHASSCGDDHKPQMREFLDAMARSIEDDPQDRPLVDVADELLDEVFEEQPADR